MMKKILNHPLFSGSAIMFAGNMGSNAINYIYHLLMGRFLGPIGYGVLASLYSVLYLVSIIPSSASISVVKFISTAEDKEVYSIYDSIKKMIFKLSVVISIIMIFASPTMAKFLHINDLLPVFTVAPILFFSLITLVNQSTSQGLLKFTGSVLPTFISSILKLVLGIILVIAGWSVFGAMLAVIIGMFFAYLYSQKFINEHIRVTKIKTVNLKPFLKYSGPVLIQSLAFTSIFTVDVLLAKHFLDAFSAGIYAALSTLGKIIFFATSPISATMFPIISKRKSLHQKYIKVFYISIVITLLVSAVITVAYWLFPNIAIGLLYGKDYLSAKTDLIWMGLFMLFYSLSFLLVNFALSTGKVKVVAAPLLAAITQIIAIWYYHGNITQIVQISLLVVFILFICLTGYTGYNIYNESRNS